MMKIALTLFSPIEECENSHDCNWCMHRKAFDLIGQAEFHNKICYVCIIQPTHLWY